MSRLLDFFHHVMYHQIVLSLVYACVKCSLEWNLDLPLAVVDQDVYLHSALESRIDNTNSEASSVIQEELYYSRACCTAEVIFQLG